MKGLLGATYSAFFVPSSHLYLTLNGIKVCHATLLWSSDSKNSIICQKLWQVLVKKWAQKSVVVYLFTPHRAKHFFIQNRMNVHYSYSVTISWFQKCLICQIYDKLKYMRRNKIWCPAPHFLLVSSALSITMSSQPPVGNIAIMLQPAVAQSLTWGFPGGFPTPHFLNLPAGNNKVNNTK